MSRSRRTTTWLHLSDETAGFVLALGSAAAISATYVVRKTVSGRVNPATFSVWWYGLAGLYAWALSALRGELGRARGIRTGWRPTVALVLANAAGALLYYSEIDLANPSLVAFFGRLRTIYIVLLGAVIVGERLNQREWTGAAVTVLGTLLIAYRGGATLNLVFLMALVENLLMALATIAAKYAVRHVSPTVLAAYRGVLIAAAILVYALISGQWMPVDGRSLAIIAAGACSGPFLGHVMRFEALARVAASKAAIVTAVQPVFVLLYTWVLFGDLPTAQQAAGGAPAIAGVVLVFSARRTPRRAVAAE